jgi:hypothetical protein
LHIHLQRSLVRIIPAFITVLVVVASALPAHAQNFVVAASGGPTITDAGHSLAAGVGVSLASRVTLLINVERTHLSTRVDTTPGVRSEFRGGTMTDAAAELRVSLLGHDRAGPYLLAGFSAGQWKGNVTRTFPNPLEEAVVAPFAGAGIQVPLGSHLNLFVDGRLMLMVGRDSDTLGAIGPIRGGLAFRF